MHIDRTFYRRQMIKQSSGGSIVFIASISAHRVNFPQPQIGYNVSKGALLQLKSSLAAEWARYGIRVNSVSPGYMDTILNEGEGLARARKIWTERNPMTGPVVLLCSGAGRYITGADIVVDGKLRRMLSVQICMALTGELWNRRCGFILKW
jgi:sorbose reductase